MAKLIGTAGHVDHGKTTLIQSLTGIDADRLPEEKARGMTIDIGFAFVDLPGIGRVSIVDVPGHEKFVTNMLVGALGIDVALLCVAADAGVMPQTREHFQIIELLPVDRMIVALTRADLADEEMREMAALEVTELLEPTRFKSSKIIPVSALTGEGLDDLKAELKRTLSEKSQESSGPWYLPIDRVFPVKGYGCVVTGTLAQGHVVVGDSAVIEPGHREVRVRGIHLHSDQATESEKGKRTAINLAGVKVEDVQRGQAVGAPGALFETSILDAQVRWVGPFKHGWRVRVSIGAEEAIGKMFLSDLDETVVQLRLETPIACALGQPLIIRRYSPPDLLGGGKVITPQAVKRRKGELPQKASGSDEQAILDLVGSSKAGMVTDEICRVLGKSPQALGGLFEKLLEDEKLLGFAGLWMTPELFEAGSEKFLKALATLHERSPATANLPREKVVEVAGLPWSGKPLDRMIARMSALGQIQAQGTSVKLAGFAVQLSAKQRNFLDRVLAVLDQSGIAAPYVDDIARAVPAPPQAVEEMLRLGVEAREIVRVGDGLFYSVGYIERLKSAVRDKFGKRPFAASEFRDAFGTSRKYAIPLLEHLDSIRFTLRVGDNRVVADE